MYKLKNMVIKEVTVDMFLKERSFEKRHELERTARNELKEIKKSCKTSIKFMKSRLTNTKHNYDKRYRSGQVVAINDFLFYENGMYRGSLASSRIILKKIKQTLKIEENKTIEIEKTLNELIEILDVRNDLKEDCFFDMRLMKQIVHETDKYSLFDYMKALDPYINIEPPEEYVLGFYQAYIDNQILILRIKQIIKNNKKEKEWMKNDCK